MSEGVPVFGAASMGALRAAELHEFGMRGVGRIFEAFRDGALEDDDEVAVMHGPAEIGFPPASEAMVNIRATLALAEAKGVIGAESRRALEAFAKALFFADRNWPALLAGGRRARRRRTRAGRACAIGCRRDASTRSGWTRSRCSPRCGRRRPPANRRPRPFISNGRIFGTPSSPGREVSASAPAAKDQRILDELRLQGPEAYRQVESKALLRMVAAKRRGRGRARVSTRRGARDAQAAARAIRLFMRAPISTAGWRRTILTRKPSRR